MFYNFKIPKEKFGLKTDNVIGVESLKIIKWTKLKNQKFIHK